MSLSRLACCSSAWISGTRVGNCAWLCRGGGQLGHWRWQAQLIAPNDGPPADGPQADAGDEEHECRDNNPKLRVVRQEVWKPDTEHGQAHGKRHGCDLGHVGMVGAGTVIACAAVASHPARAVGQRGISDWRARLC